MNETLQYKNEAEVKTIVGRSRRLFIVMSLLWLSIVAPVMILDFGFDMHLLGAGSASFNWSNPDVDTPLKRAIIFIVFVGGGALQIMALARNPYMSADVVSKEQCQKLATFLDQYSDVEAYVKKVNSERALMVYDYGVILKWAAQHEHAVRAQQLQQKQDLACKRVKSIF